MNDFAAVQPRHRLARQRQGMGIVVGQMVGHARQAGVHIATTQIFSGHDFANGSLDQRRAAQEDGALVFHDDGLVAHGRHIGAARGATAHDHGNLRDALGAHIGLVVEDAAKVLLIGKHVVLVGQIRAARVDQVNARQVVLLGNLLGPQMLFHGHGVISAALDSGVIANNHTIHATDPTQARNHTGARCIPVVHAVGGQGAEFQKRGARVQQQRDPFAWRQFAARQLLGPR